MKDALYSSSGRQPSGQHLAGATSSGLVQISPLLTLTVCFLQLYMLGSCSAFFDFFSRRFNEACYRRLG